MIVVVANRTPGVGKTLLAVHLAGELALRHHRVLLADAGLGAGALRWAEVRRRHGHPALFEVAGLDRGLIESDGLRKALLALAGGCEHVIVDTPPHPFDRMPTLLAAADLVLLPIVPEGDPPATVRSSIVAAVQERQRRPELAVRVVYNGIRRVVAPEVLALVNGAHLVGTAAALRDWSVLSWVLPIGLLVQESAGSGPAATSLSLIVSELFGQDG